MSARDPQHLEDRRRHGSQRLRGDQRRRGEWSGIGPVDAWGTRRRSTLLPELTLVHADLHNHTLLSDGAGDPADAFASMRREGLDVAAITDHLTVGPTVLGRLGLAGKGSLDRAGWAQLAELADAANDEGTFVALRGFEWSHRRLGHVSVWDSTGLARPCPDDESLPALWQWLLTSGDARHALAGFNHPGGRGTARFGGFHFEQALVERMVGLELFNKADDYLFEGAGQEGSPLVDCLARGWRPALLGVSDEHGSAWGAPEGKGRSGLWVSELSRWGVREALLSRRTFATRAKGLRLAVTVGGVPMGDVLRHSRGDVEIDVDVDMGPGSAGRPLSIQVLRPAERMPAVAAAVDAHVPGPEERPVRLHVELDAGEGAWAVVRVSDPSQPADPRADAQYARLGRTVAYASPVWLDAGPPTVS
ncbi:MAG: CehA/McbA family metallohydrolase [Acidimicrobiales bacterium]